MTTRKLFYSACIGAVATICLPAAKLAAQTASDATFGVVTSASGQERHLRCHENVLDRVGLAPDQLVTVTLQFPLETMGNRVFVLPLDGGTVTTLDGSHAFIVGEEGTIAFAFRAPPPPGLYRVIAQLGEDDYRFQFYVLDLVHPERNPPRLQVVY